MAQQTDSPLGTIVIEPGNVPPLPVGVGNDDIGVRYAQTRIATEKIEAIQALEEEFGAELDVEERIGEAKRIGVPIPNPQATGLEDRAPELDGRPHFDTDDIEGAYGASRSDTEKFDAIRALEEEFGAEIDAETKKVKPLSETLPLALQQEQEETPIFNFADVLTQTVFGGPFTAAQETLEAMDSLAVWLNDNVLDLSVMDRDEDFELNMPDVPDPTSVAGGVARGISQFITGFIGAGKFTRLSRLKPAIKKLGGFKGKAAEAARFGIQGAIADGIAFDPNEENLSDLLIHLTDDQENAVLNFLASDPEDSEATLRLKAAFEGFAIGGLVDGLFMGLRALRAARKLKQTTLATAAAGGTLTANASETEGNLPEGQKLPELPKRQPEETQQASLPPEPVQDKEIADILRPELFDALVMRESRGDPKARSHAGALGLTQVMPVTAAKPGFGITPILPNIDITPAKDGKPAFITKPADRKKVEAALLDPEQNLRFGHDYISKMLEIFNGDEEAALIAYNAGPGNARRFLKAGRDYSVLPRRGETEPYVRDILSAAGQVGHKKRGSSG